MLESKNYNLSSGKELVINIAHFKTQIALCNTLFKVLKSCDLDFKSDMLQLSIDKLLQSPQLITSLAKAFLTALSDPQIEAIFWECGKFCTYDGLRVTQDLFVNDVEARSDYYQVLFLILKENVAVFFPKLRTELAGQQ